MQCTGGLNRTPRLAGLHSLGRVNGLLLYAPPQHEIAPLQQTPSLVPLEHLHQQAHRGASKVRRERGAPLGFAVSEGNCGIYATICDLRLLLLLTLGSRVRFCSTEYMCFKIL